MPPVDTFHAAVLTLSLAIVLVVLFAHRKVSRLLVDLSLSWTPVFRRVRSSLPLKVLVVGFLICLAFVRPLLTFSFLILMVWILACLVSLSRRAFKNAPQSVRKPAEVVADVATLLVLVVGLTYAVYVLIVSSLDSVQRLIDDLDGLAIVSGQQANALISSK